MLPNANIEGINCEVSFINENGQIGNAIKFNIDDVIYMVKITTDVRVTTEVGVKTIIPLDTMKKIIKITCEYVSSHVENNNDNDISIKIANNIFIVKIGDDDKYKNVKWYKLFFLDEHDRFYQATYENFKYNNTTDTSEKSKESKESKESKKSNKMITIHNLKKYYDKFINDFDMMTDRKKEYVEQFIYYILRYCLLWNYKLPKYQRGDFYSALYRTYMFFKNEHTNEPITKIILDIITHNLYTYDVLIDKNTYSMLYIFGNIDDKKNYYYYKMINITHDEFIKSVFDFFGGKNNGNNYYIKNAILLSVNGEPHTQLLGVSFLKSVSVDDGKIDGKIKMNNLDYKTAFKIIYKTTKDFYDKHTINMQIIIKDKKHVSNHYANLNEYIFSGFYDKKNVLFDNKGNYNVDINSKDDIILSCNNFYSLNKHLFISEMDENTIEQNYKKITNNEEYKRIMVKRSINIYNKLGCENHILLMQVAHHLDGYVPINFVKDFCVALKKFSDIYITT